MPVSTDVQAALSAYPAAAVCLACALTLVIDRLLRRAGRRLDHLRAHVSMAAVLAAATAGVRLLLRLARPAVWLALAWLSGEISPSLLFVRDFIYVVGSTAVTAPVFMLNQHDYSILDAIELPVAVLLAWLTVTACTRIVDRRLERSGRIDAGTRQTLTLLARCMLATVAALVVLHAWGVDLKSVTLAASVLGVGVGFGLQNVTSNFVSGLLVSLERPIRPGDFVKVGELTGVVERIGLRSTEIVTLDRVSILVPNSVFLEREVVNWSHGDPVYRLHVPIAVAYGSDVTLVRAALLAAAESHRAVLREPQPRVEFRGFGESALDFVLLIWARDPKQQGKLRSDMNYRVEASLRRYGIRIPFPQLDVNFPRPAAAFSVAERNGNEHCYRAAAQPGIGRTEAVLARDAAELAPATARTTCVNGSALSALAGAFDEVCDTHAWADSELRALVASMNAAGGVTVADRRHRFRVYRNCFVGSDAVDWIVKKLAMSRREAVELGHLLVARHFVHHVTHEQPFRDGPYFYRFRAEVSA